MSRSCQSATSSSAGTTAERTSRARPVRFSVRIGLRLCGMADEPFWPGSNGSSASSTSVRSAVVPALEDVALWHERDISHSSVERGIGPDATVHLDFALRRLAGVIERLVVYPENMRKNLDRLGGLVHSQRVLLALTQKGVAREDAYAAVQSNAMKVWRGEGRFLDLLKADPAVRPHLTDAQLAELFDDAYHFKHVDTIFERVFGKDAAALKAAE